MAAAVDLVLNDGQGTPVAHTFSPARKDGVLVEYEERLTAHTPSGFFTIGISQSSLKKNSSVIRMKVSLALPIEVFDTSTSAYSYPNVCRFNIDVLIPTTATSSVRNDVAAYAKNLLAHTVIQNMIKNLDAPF